MNRELESLNQKVKRVMGTVENVLVRELGENRTISQLTIRDRHLLTNLEVWAERYRVTTDWIVEILILHYAAIVKEKKKKKMGLPVRVNVLVSKTSENLICRTLGLMFPNGENVGLWKEQEQERILDERMNQGDSVEGVRGIPHNVTELSFKTLSGYREYYRDRTEKRRRMWRKVREQEKKTGLPYRGSPWK